uniref:Uncharacterized protein n=3 Tax=Bursaphelenchus xylophilus TaxID=6326 RepID=A0A1I7SIE2_BURXY
MTSSSLFFRFSPLILFSACHIQRQIWSSGSESGPSKLDPPAPTPRKQSKPRRSTPATTTIAQPPVEAWPRPGTQSYPNSGANSFDEASSSLSLPNASPDLANLHDLHIQSPQEQESGGIETVSSCGVKHVKEERPVVCQARSSSFCHTIMPSGS